LQSHDVNSSDASGPLGNYLMIENADMFQTETIMFVLTIGSVVMADWRNNLVEKASSLCVNTCVWLAWWIICFPFVYLSLSPTSNYHAMMCNAPFAISFYCSSMQASASFAVLALLLHTAYLIYAAYEFYLIKHQLPMWGELWIPRFIVGSLLLGMLGELMWGSAVMKLSSTDSYSRVDPIIVQSQLTVLLLFILIASLLCRVLFDGRQSIGSVTFWTSVVSSLVGWSVTIWSFRRLSTLAIYGSADSQPPCSFGSLCAAQATVVTGVLLITVAETALAVLVFLYSQDLPEDVRRSDVLLDAHDSVYGSMPTSTG